MNKRKRRALRRRTAKAKLKHQMARGRYTSYDAKTFAKGRDPDWSIRRDLFWRRGGRWAVILACPDTSHVVRFRSKADARRFVRGLGACLEHGVSPIFTRWSFQLAESALFWGAFIRTIAEVDDFRANPPEAKA